MSFWVAGAAIGGAVISGVVSSNNADKAADAARDVATTPTRVSEIDQLLSELQTTAEQEQSTNLQEFVNSTVNSSGEEQTFNQTTNQSNQNTSSQENQNINENSNSQISQQQDTNNTSNINNSTDQTTNTTGTTQGSTDATVQRGNELNQAALDNLTAELSLGGTDTTAAVQSLMSQIMRSGQTGVNDATATTGTFDSTTAALLQNDLNTKAAEAGAQLQIDQQNTQTDQLLAAIAAGQQGTEATSALTSEQQQVQEALQGNTTTQQTDQGTTNTTENNQSNTSTSGSTFTDSNQSTNVTENALSNSSNRTNENGTTATNAQEDSTASSTENSSQQDVSIGDEFHDPSNGVKAAIPNGSPLASLLSTGSVNTSDPSPLTGAAATSSGNGLAGLGDIGGALAQLANNPDYFKNIATQYTNGQYTGSSIPKGGVAVTQPTTNTIPAANLTPDDINLLLQQLAV